MSSLWGTLSSRKKNSFCNWVRLSLLWCRS